MIRAIIILLFFLQLEIAAQTNFTDSLLTKEEIKWLNDNREDIKYTPNSFWPPDDYIDDNGVHKGIVDDYIKFFEKKLGLSFLPVYYKNRTDIIEELKNSNVDLVAAVQKNSEREKYLIFTDSFLTIPLVILVRDDYNKELSKNQINNLTLACVSGYSSLYYIKKTYPGANIINCKDDLDALLKTSTGNAD